MGSQLKGIKLNQIYQSQITILYLMYASNSFTNCYHSVNEISLGLAQNDPIKWRLLDHEDLIKYLNVMWESHIPRKIQQYSKSCQCFQISIEYFTFEAKILIYVFWTLDCWEKSLTKFFMKFHLKKGMYFFETSCFRSVEICIISDFKGFDKKLKSII
jgi:hypothetical protein